MVRSVEDAVSTLREVVSTWEQNRKSLDVLEAGGGSVSRIPFTKRLSITVIDISEEQLSRSEADNKILGDLHNVKIDQQFDAVVCYDVVEHLRDPGAVVDKLCHWLRPGGLLVIAAPNRQSFSGLITRMTPHWFHIWALRTLFGSATAGQPGHPPFVTVHHRDIAPKNLVARISGYPEMSVSNLCLYQSARAAELKARHPVIGAAYYSIMGTMGILVGETAQESDFFLIATKHSPS